MVGNEDKATIPAKAAFTHENITHSYFAYINNAGHFSSIEDPEQVNTAIEGFLISLENT
jgi:pimeloyl-ACP methyl ester carboxylesterase